MISIEVIIIILLIVYGLVITYLLYDQYRNQDLYMKDKIDYINSKAQELALREKNVSAREVCDRELIKLRTIHKSALDVLNSYIPMTIASTSTSASTSIGVNI
jgi:hypothetical protein